MAVYPVILPIIIAIKTITFFDMTNLDTVFCKDSRITIIHDMNPIHIIYKKIDTDKKHNYDRNQEGLTHIVNILFIIFQAEILQKTQLDIFKKRYFFFHAYVGVPRTNGNESHP